MEGQNGFPIMALCFIPFLAFGPMVLYALFVWWFDRFEKEPLWLMGAAFLWGSLPTVLLSICAQLPMAAVFGAVAGERAGGALSAIIAAPITEELFKGAFVLLLFLIYRREIDSLYDGFLYGSLVGFGFAATENVLYFIGAAAAGGLAGMFANFVARAIFFGLNHAAWTALTGMGFAAARLSRSAAVKMAAPMLGLGGAMAFHALHNTIATLTEATQSVLPCLLWLPASWMGVLLIFGIAVYGLFRERQWIRMYLREEVEAGRLPEPVYRECGSFTARLGSRLRALLRGDLEGFRRLGRLHHAAAELAFRKHQRAALGEARWEGEIERLRAELRRWAEA
ncbi:PrsW family intramembrane metalloprotease [Thermoflexus sp.]|uniref:PrsW family intramembrane metalloprotease n=1 Tax=Thermoflexus sp. TaxID=1969742 RepID=UPI0025D41A7F|nr:PrsW family intramembrane metalloprotease [Thermoflexus sp.]MCS6964574.1 PrsW family intramembrane metalloprotease [Thermoflexus sp.]MCX7691078.1 PrsW family intramembrane metalloprotease [Thermoflexus sp.]MDW8186250.1 PrsW family intramembrane metalloprotease [Anaerolineae bacterium]